MLIVTPKAEIIIPKNKESHIAKCARVCFGKDEGDDNKTYNNILDKKHYSMLRHWTIYLSMSISKNKEIFYSLFKNNPYCSVNSIIEKGESVAYITTNYQYFYELYNSSKYINNFDELFSTSIIKYHHIPTEHHDLRITVKLITQISTTRELNRLSPNNISEQSTRYCNYSNNNFGNEVSICLPVWLENKVNNIEQFINNYNTNKLITENYINTTEDKIRIKDAIEGWEKNEISYFTQLNLNATPQEAREQLALVTKSEVIYTYSLKEWNHIFDLRYFGTTGKPHPNAKKVIGLVYNLFKDNNYIK